MIPRLSDQIYTYSANVLLQIRHLLFAREEGRCIGASRHVKNVLWRVKTQSYLAWLPAYSTFNLFDLVCSTRSTTFTSDVCTEERSRSNSKISRRHIQNLIFPHKIVNSSSCAGIGKIRPESRRELDH